jgi:hypothetical protein
MFNSTYDAAAEAGNEPIDASGQATNVQVLHRETTSLGAAKGLSCSWTLESPSVLHHDAIENKIRVLAFDAPVPPSLDFG